MSENGQSFGGFPMRGLQLLAELAANNNRAWFEAHKAELQTQLLSPAQSFVLALGTRLRAIDANLHIDPRTDGGGVLMRIYRDTRFSSDPSPYKTNISGLFWAGSGKMTERPAFGFQLSPDGLDLMASIFVFPPALLAAYRQVVADERHGKVFATVADGRLVVKLRPERIAELMIHGQGQAFVGYGKVMRSWIQLTTTDDDAWLRFAEEDRAYIAA